MMSECLSIYDSRQVGFLAIELGYDIVGYKRADAMSVRMDRKETCIKELMQVTHEKNGVAV